ncbi:MAG TPA: BlaI/MecI/CopY family transcriptional regulator [Planctomycetota bacterium]
MPRSPKSRTHPRTDLSKLEMEVMNEIWRLGECSSNDVIEAFGKRRPLAPTTIRTVVTKLRAKGYVEAVPTIERAMRLRPIVARDSVVRRTLDRLRDSLFGGSPREAIAYLLDSEKISEAELTELRQLIDARRARRKS